MAGNANSGSKTPSKFNETVGNAIVALYKESKTDKQVCAAIGISTRTLNIWRNKHKGLAEQIAESRAVADELVVATLFQKALGTTVPETKVFYDPKTGKCIEHVVDNHNTHSPYPQAYHY